LKELYAGHVGTLAHGYAKALAASGFDAVVLHSGSLKKRSDFDDQYWRLRPTPHFAHWCPLQEVDCAMIVAQGAPPKLVRPTAVDFWEHPASPETDHWREIDVVEVKTADDVKPHLPKGRVAFVGEDASRAASWGIAAVNPEALVKALDALRTIKTPYEVLCLADANRRAALGHEAVLQEFLAGDASELDLHLR